MKKYYFYKICGPFVRRHISSERAVLELLIQENIILRTCKQDGVQLWQKAALAGPYVFWRDIEETKAKEIIKSADPRFSWVQCR